MENKEFDGDSHIYLYAKRWYKQSNNPFNDLRKIYSVRNGIEEQYITDINIIENISCLVFKHLKENNFRELMLRIFRKKSFLYYSRITSMRRVLLELLSILSIVQVYETKTKTTLINLAQPDEKILPLRP